MFGTEKRPRRKKALTAHTLVDSFFIWVPTVGRDGLKISSLFCRKREGWVYRKVAAAAEEVASLIERLTMCDHASVIGRCKNNGLCGARWR